MLGSTHGAVLWYALVLVESGLPEDLFAKIGAHVVNVAARRMAGLPGSARLESLHMVAGIQSFKNMAVQGSA